MKELKLNGRMRAQKTGCLDACEYGPTVVVYPEGTYYGGVTINDVTEIVNEHLIHNRPVERLIIEFEEKKAMNEIDTREIPERHLYHSRYSQAD
jgi:(2Fe-2S) ferredoxin